MKGIENRKRLKMLFKAKILPRGKKKKCPAGRVMKTQTKYDPITL